MSIIKVRILDFIKDNIGIDRSILWGVLNRGLGFIRGPISIYFLVTYLTPGDQGLWYTFGSLSALTIFAELGFTSIITQFVSHEFAKIPDKEKLVDSGRSDISRLIGLIQFSIKFYLLIIPTAIVILLVVGYFYFKTELTAIYFAWFVFSITGGFGLFIGLLQSIYQGLDKVKDIQKNIFISTTINTVLTWIFLMLHFKIWALVLGNLLGLMLTTILLFNLSPGFWKLIYKFKLSEKFNFLTETLPLQLRYAVTWISSYFVIYLYIPATYKLVGDIQAGQFGITYSIFTTISSVANNWVFTKVPKFNMHAALKDVNSLNILFKRSSLQGFSVLIFLYMVFILALFFLKIYLPNIAVRFMDIKLTILFMIPQIAQYFIGILATYLRAHKEEPFMWVSVLMAFLLIGSVFGILSLKLGLEILFYVLIIIYWIIILPIALKIFFDKRKLYLTKYY